MLREKELMIISELRKNARIPLTEISAKTKTPVSTVFSKIKKYEKGIINKHTSLVSFAKLGLTWTKILLKVKRKDRERLKEFALNNKNVNSLFEINHGYDFLLETIHKNQNQLKDFIEELEERFELEQRDVYAVINDLKREGFWV